jgi:hypothetical protein
VAAAVAAAERLGGSGVGEHGSRSSGRSTGSEWPGRLGRQLRRSCRLGGGVDGGGGSGGGVGGASPHTWVAAAARAVARAATLLEQRCRSGGGVGSAVVSTSDGGSGVGGSVASARGVCAVVIGSYSCGLGEQRGGQQAAGTEASEGQRRGANAAATVGGGCVAPCSHARRIVKLCVRPSYRRRAHAACEVRTRAGRAQQVLRPCTSARRACGTRERPSGAGAACGESGGAGRTAASGSSGGGSDGG